MLIIFQGGFAKCYELTDMDTNQVMAGKIVPKSLLVKQHQKDKVSSTTQKCHLSGNFLCALLSFQLVKPEKIGKRIIFVGLNLLSSIFNLYD
jgi:hypothetical protein